MEEVEGRGRLSSADGGRRADGGERSATDSAWMDDGSNGGDGVMTEGQRWVAMGFGRNELSVFIGRRSMQAAEWCRAGVVGAGCVVLLSFSSSPCSCPR